MTLPLVILKFTTKTMEQKKIPFSGIDRATDDGVSQDGACMELINARIKHGSVEAIGKPVLVSELSLSVKTLYYHAIASKVIAFASNGDIYSMGNDYSNPTKLSDDISGADRVEFLGNLCCFFVGKDIRYVLYKNGGYYYLGTKPRLPSITITQTTKVGQALSSTELYPDITKFSDIDDSAKVPCASTGYYDSIVHDLNRDGYYTGAVLLRYALRLTNNSYICHSPIMVVNYMDDVSASLQFDGTQSTFSATLSQKSPFVYANKNWDDTTYRDKADIYKFALLGIKHSYSFSSINLSVWKGLIASIDVFVSPLCWYSKEKVEGKNYEIYEEKSIDKYGKSATDAHMFYKVAEYAIDGTMNNRLDDVSIDSLSVQETLTDDQFSNNLFSGATSYVYNSMLDRKSVV